MTDDPRLERPRRPLEPTATSAFGVSRRENHDASEFYARFTLPALSADSRVAERRDLDELVCGDARDMGAVPDASAALVVTSPPYFAGKAYEQALGEGHIPGSYVEYLQMLTDVFAECVRCLEPGGRIAVNVANLGRKPYRSLSADVISILQDDLRLLLRGEVVWIKARGAGGNCAWGSFQRPGNPVIRDLSERVVIASKGRFDRAVPARARARRGLPSTGSIGKDEFMEATTDLWELPAESATRIGHPAPFPVALPERLIHLYTYRGDLVLDPFVGSGTTAVAAVRTGRRFVGYDTDPGYVSMSQARVREEQQRVERHGPASRVEVPPGRTGPRDPSVAGATATEQARELLDAAGFSDLAPARRAGIELAFEATGRDRPWFVEVVGAHTSGPGGLRRSDLLWRTIGRATVLRQRHPDTPILVLTTELPAPRSPGAQALRSVLGTTVTDVVELGADDARARLEAHCQGRTRTAPVVDADELAPRRRPDGRHRARSADA